MSSLFRVWNISNGGKQIINLTKISSFTLNDKTITFTIDHEKMGFSVALCLLEVLQIRKDHLYGILQKMLKRHVMILCQLSIITIKTKIHKIS